MTWKDSSSYRPSKYHQSVFITSLYMIALLCFIHRIVTTFKSDKSLSDDLESNVKQSKVPVKPADDDMHKFTSNSGYLKTQRLDI
jgi:hypothetical protein